LSFKAFVAFAFGKLHSSPSSTRVIFVAEAAHVLNDKFCRKKLDHLLVLYMKKCRYTFLITSELHILKIENGWTLDWWIWKYVRICWNMCYDIFLICTGWHINEWFFIIMLKKSNLRSIFYSVCQCLNKVAFTAGFNLFCKQLTKTKINENLLVKALINCRKD
jgi:hypothetical protein